ncbi:hypothetical protein GCM10022254_28740 [Actinomadura meridiana]|uniref:Uncharacterized protein n=1 Tax=Actinomadura meridiana TaxID=559626 RepID=A0ABP8C0L5_9ACTN
MRDAVIVEAVRTPLGKGKASGVESMSRVPMGSNVLPGSDPFGTMFAERYPEGMVGQGISAELIVARVGTGA